MAKEIQASSPTGLNLYCVIFNTVGQVYNGTSFVTLANSLPTYARALTESALLGEYTADFPALAAGRYYVEVRKLLGAAPASSNAATTDPVVAAGDMDWSGTATTSTAGAIVTTYTGNTPQTGDAYARLGATPPTAAAIVTAMFAFAVESGISFQQIVEAIGAATAGDYDAATTSFRAVGNHATTRLTTALSSNNRTNTPSL